jgi:hypothetical protein
VSHATRATPNRRVMLGRYVYNRQTSESATGATRRRQLAARERLAPDDSRMSASTTVAATPSPWFVVIAAAVGAGAALIVGILTQLWTGHRENVRWSREREDRDKQWEREGQARREQWGRERDDRREQWQREDSLRWQQDRQRAYAGLMAALDEWDREMNSVVVDLKLAARLGERAEVEVDEIKRLGTVARQASALVQLMAPEAVRSLAESAVRDRQAYRGSMSPKIIGLSGDNPSDFTELDARRGRLYEGTSRLREAMRDDLGIKSQTGPPGGHPDR